jgi:hypothetical protein
MKDIAVILFLLLVVILLMIGSMAMVDYLNCTAQTAHIGFGSNWSLFGGCQINVKDGIWIPLKNYRYLGD